MIITVKYDGKCVSCGKKVRAGQKVVWEKGKGVYCNKCKAPKATANNKVNNFPRYNGRWVICWECGRRYYDNSWYPGKDTYCGC